MDSCGEVVDSAAHRPTTRDRSLRDEGVHGGSIYALSYSFLAGSIHAVVNSPIRVAATQPILGFRTANEAAAGIFGYARKEMLGLPRRIADTRAAS